MTIPKNMGNITKRIITVAGKPESLIHQNFKSFQSTTEQGTIHPQNLFLRGQ